VGAAEGLHQEAQLIKRNENGKEALRRNTSTHMHATETLGRFLLIEVLLLLLVLAVITLVLWYLLMLILMVVGDDGCVEVVCGVLTWFLCGDDAFVICDGCGDSLSVVVSPSAE
jgi:hypothetical protein